MNVRIPPSNVISIESARIDNSTPPPGGASSSRRKGNIVNQHSASQAVARFFGLGKNVYQIHRETGYPVAALQEEIRRVGYAAWARKAGRAA